MRGLKVSYSNLAELMKQGRETKNIRLQDAAMLIGVTNGQYLWACENGHANFPAGKIKRAIELYGLKKADVITAICEDFRAGAIEFLRDK